MAKKHLLATSMLFASALAIMACSEAAMETAPSDETSIFTTPDREEGDILCELTGTFESSADCTRFERQYEGLRAGVDAFNPSETMVADKPTIVRYAITRLPDSVQGEDGELADAVPEPTPTPSPSPTPTPSPSPSATAAPTGRPTFAPRPGLTPGPGPIATATPIPNPSLTPIRPAGNPGGTPVAGTPQPIRIERSDTITDTRELAVEAGVEAAPPTPEGPTQAEIDAAMAAAGGRVSQIIGRDEDSNEVEVGTVKIGRLMYACLEADPSFQVERQKCQTRNTIEDPDADWRWTVTPTEPGEGYELKLRSGIVVRAADGTLRRIGQPSRSAEIDVTVTALGRFQRFLAQAEEWILSPIGLLGALAALLFAIGKLRKAWKAARDGTGGEEEVPQEESAPADDDSDRDS